MDTSTGRGNPGDEMPALLALLMMLPSATVPLDAWMGARAERSPAPVAQPLQSSHRSQVQLRPVRAR